MAGDLTFKLYVLLVHRPTYCAMMPLPHIGYGQLLVLDESLSVLLIVS